MNTRHLWLASVGLAAAALAGCSTETVVTLQNGTQYITRAKPDTKNADGFYEFTDISGKHVRVRADEVATVKPED
ncbi:lipoprotein [Pseudomonas sp. M47T1]|uniref:YgdI/YgdR family lipoprotein n=1 Tax=unclassified Pseudomonas TaxID=196821 RepID=UPI0002608683|nr:YgdI/YgdR family lipoprotein [Pseudomonas sp. M47T1]EIK93282.1 lipoprotein [Pseudomonas sp. M47T1]